jgi:hypothetical protein
LIEKISHQLVLNSLDHIDIREVAKSEDWKSMWASSNGNPFNDSYVDLTDEQRTLLLYSNMYDNARKHPECPDDDVFNDDDMFDGWMIFQKRKSDREKTENDMQNKFGDAKMISFGLQDENIAGMSAQEQIDRINNMNSQEAKLVRQRREQELAKKGSLRHADLPDVKDELLQKAQEEFAAKMRKK